MTGPLRELVAADIPALDAVLQVAYGASRSYDRRLHDALRNGSSRTFVIDGDAGPIAMGTLNDYGTIGYVAMMGVAPAYQRQGVGRRLMDAILAESLERGHEVLALESSDAGQRLYDALGFQKIGVTLGVAGPARAHRLRTCAFAGR